MIKTDIVGLYKDETSGAVLNKDNSALAAYKAKKQQASEISKLKQRVASLESRLLLLEAKCRGDS